MKKNKRAPNPLSPGAFPDQIGTGYNTMFSDTGRKEVIAFVSRLVWYFILKIRKRILKILKMAYIALSNFFNRIAYRKGRHAAISATSRKLAVIIWNMIVKGVPL